MRWPWKKRPPPVSESADVAYHRMKEDLKEGKSGFVMLEGEQALDFLQMLCDEEGGMPDELREFLQRRDWTGDSP